MSKTQKTKTEKPLKLSISYLLLPHNKYADAQWLQTTNAYYFTVSVDQESVNLLVGWC